MKGGVRMYLTVKQKVKHLTKDEYKSIKELSHIAKKYYFLIDKMQNIQYNISDEKEVIIYVFNIKATSKTSQ